MHFQERLLFLNIGLQFFTGFFARILLWNIIACDSIFAGIYEGGKKCIDTGEEQFQRNHVGGRACRASPGVVGAAEKILSDRGAGPACHGSEAMSTVAAEEKI